jgi:transcriptional regulator with XRE-family HTH domain
MMEKLGSLVASSRIEVERPGAGGGLLPLEQDYDDVYKMKLRKFLDGLGIDILELSSRALDRFDRAALKMHGRAIGEWIEANRRRMGKSQEKIALMIGVDISSVTKWINGDANISQKNLTKLQSRFGGDGIPLRLPAAKDLVLEGYRSAVGFIRSELTGEEACPPRGEDLLCLHHPYSEPSWERLRIGGKGDREFRSLARSILERAGVFNHLAGAVENRPCRMAAGGQHTLDDVRFLNGLIGKWGISWLVCIEILPLRGDI